METALKYIYYDMGTGRGQEGFQLLQQAVQDGDADACCLLARCLYGPEYTWPGHGFPVDDRTGDESVLGGSAIGVLLSLRSGVMDRRLAQAMPFGGLQDAFDLVLDKAEQRGGGSTAGLQVKMSAGKSAEALPYGSASALFSLCRAQNRPADIKNEGGEKRSPAGRTPSGAARSRESFTETLTVIDGSVRETHTLSLL